MEKKETQIAVIELVCSSARLWSNVKRSVLACDLVAHYIKERLRETHWRYCVKKLSAALLYSLSKHTPNLFLKGYILPSASTHLM